MQDKMGEGRATLAGAHSGQKGAGERSYFNVSLYSEM